MELKLWCIRTDTQEYPLEELPCPCETAEGAKEYVQDLLATREHQNPVVVVGFVETADPYNLFVGYRMLHGRMWYKSGYGVGIPTIRFLSRDGYELVP